MDPMRDRSFTVTAKTRKAALAVARKATKPEAQPSVVDLLNVNAELSYTTVVEGLEEFLYQQELQSSA